jgi:hypothetical protein
MVHFIGNRAKQLFQQAAKKTDTGKPVLFIYWNTYKDPVPDYDATGYDQVIRQLPRKLTNPFDDKGRLGELMSAHPTLLPPTFNNVRDIPQQLAHPDSKWFLKNRHGAGGSSVECVRYSDLRDHTLKKWDILQHAITDIQLVDNKKYTIRAYVLVWDSQLFLYDKWYRVIHGGRYCPEATDYDIQVSMRYEGGGTNFTPHTTQTTPDEFSALREVNGRIKTVLEPLVAASDRNNYALLGCDYLIKASGEAIMIEINAYPNLVHLDQTILDQVNIPMIQDTVSLLSRYDQSNGWNAV